MTVVIGQREHEFGLINLAQVGELLEKKDLHIKGGDVKLNKVSYEVFKKRELVKKLKNNGYVLNRHSGSHQIFKNENGNIISVPKSVNPMICRRLIKENKLY